MSPGFMAMFTTTRDPDTLALTHNLALTLPLMLILSPTLTHFLTLSRHDQPLALNLRHEQPLALNRPRAASEQPAILTHSTNTAPITNPNRNAHTILMHMRKPPPHAHFIPNPYTLYNPKQA